MKTHRVILASDACERGNIIHTMASRINQLAFDHLDAPSIVLGARNWIAPAYELEDEFLPVASDFLDAFHQYIEPLPEYPVKRACDHDEILRRERLGV